MQAHSWRRPSSPVYPNWGVLLDASAQLEASSITPGLPMLGRALGCKCIAGGALYYAWCTYVEACAWMQVHS